MTRVLVIGASGYIGAVVAEEWARRHDVTATARRVDVPGTQPLDLSDHDRLAQLVADADIVINAAGVARSEQAESDPEAAESLNVRSVQVMVNAARDRTKIIQISTDNVFDGREHCYTESSVRNPIGVYAQTKARAEDVVLRSGVHLVVRVPIVFGASPWHDAFLDRFKAPVVRAQTDVVCAPCYLPDLASHLETLRDLTGSLHLAGAEVMSRFELMSAVRDALSIDVEVQPCRESDVAGPVRRARRLVLRSERDVPKMRSFQSALADLRRRAAITADRAGPIARTRGERGRR